MTLPSKHGQPVTYALVNDAATLFYLVNQGTLTFHPWLSRTQNLDRPDFVIFDLDPSTATCADTVAVAKQLHAILEGEKVVSYVKTSGQTGLHVLVPWSQAEGYEAARGWAMDIALRLVADLPDTSTVERRKNSRQQKVDVDVMQNARVTTLSRHTCCGPYPRRWYTLPQRGPRPAAPRLQSSERTTGP